MTQDIAWSSKRMAGRPSYKKQVFYDWLSKSPSERDPFSQKDLAKKLGITESTLINWKKEKANARIMAPEEKEYDSIAYLRGRSPEADKALITSCLSGNASSLKLLKQLLGDLVEKTEVTLGLTADEIARRNLEAERQLREGGYQDATSK